MAVINDVQGLEAAILKVCPIDGVSGDGEIWFSAGATDQQKAAAVVAASAFVDGAAPPRVRPQLAPRPLPKAITEA